MLQTCRECEASLPSQRNRFWCARRSGGERAHVHSSESSSSCLRSQQQHMATMASIGLSAAVVASLMAAASSFVVTPRPALGVGGGHHRFRGQVRKTLRKKAALQASIILLQERSALSYDIIYLFFPRGRFLFRVVQAVGASRVALAYILAGEEAMTEQPLRSLHSCHDPSRACASLRPP